MEYKHCKKDTDSLPVLISPETSKGPVVRKPCTVEMEWPTVWLPCTSHLLSDHLWNEMRAHYSQIGMDSEPLVALGDPVAIMKA